LDVDSWFQRKQSSFVTVVNTKTYALPSDWRKPIAVWYLNSAGERVMLTHIDRIQHIVFFPDDTETGEPEAYHIHGGAIMSLDKTPSSVLTLYREYTALLPDYAAAGDSDLFSTDFELGLVFGACYLLSIQLGLWDSAVRYKNLHDERKVEFLKQHRAHDEGAEDRPLLMVHYGMNPEVRRILVPS
jgi:hypothetical protein